MTPFDDGKRGAQHDANIADDCLLVGPPFAPSFLQPHHDECSQSGEERSAQGGERGEFGGGHARRLSVAPDGLSLFG